jgi:hypothetical protein
MTMTKLLGALLAFVNLSAAQAPANLTFTATASVDAPGKKASVPVTIHIDRFITDADRDKLVAAVKANDHAATTKLLAGLPTIGSVKVLEKSTPIKYAYARPTGDGRLITVVTAQPIYYVGGAEKDAKPKAGYDLGLALLVLNGQDSGDGELAPAVKIKVDNGAVVTDDYGSEVVKLVKVAKAK